MYGVRLVNHVRLGNPECLKLHDFVFTRATTLQWLRAPVYSDNVRLEASSALKSCVQRLAQLCFDTPNSLISANEFSLALPNCLVEHFKQLYTPETFYHILHSLVERCVWIAEVVESLFLTALPQSLQLAWRTQMAWLNGESVLLFRANIKNQLRNFGPEVGDASGLELLLMSREEEIKLQQQKLESTGLTHCIDHLCWDQEETSFTRISPSILFDGAYFSFLLIPDHQLESDWRLHFQTFHDKEKTIMTKFTMYIPFKSFSSKGLYSIGSLHNHIIN